MTEIVDEWECIHIERAHGRMTASTQSLSGDNVCIFTSPMPRRPIVKRLMAII